MSNDHGSIPFEILFLFIVHWLLVIERGLDYLCGELGSSPFQRWSHHVCGKARHKQSLYAAKKLTDCGTD